MNIVLLSGGSGKRLWPLSNDIRSKQFIKIFKDENGGRKSMIQKVYSQIKNVDPNSTITIATSKNQVSAINNQLEEKVAISIEPYRRDTFPAMVLATAFLKDVQKIDENEVVVVCPVDMNVGDDYFVMIKNLGEQAKKGEANVVIMGSEPTYPSEKFGYIIPEDKMPVSKVKAFKEKPDAATAETYIAQGALWNGGAFAYKIKYLLDRAHEIIDFSDYHDLYSKYETLEKISFDYAVLEKEDSIQVMRFTGKWDDLGTWNTFTEAMDEQCIGNAILNETCTNVHVVNELSVPVVAVGLTDVVISASQDGILVSNKEQSSNIKSIVDQFDQQIMFAEKSWGSYTVVNVDDNSLTVSIKCNLGHTMSYHSHEERKEVWIVTSGEGRVVIDEKTSPVKAGDVITINPKCKHTIIADTDLNMIEIQIGENISVTDKEKHNLNSDIVI